MKLVQMKTYNYLCVHIILCVQEQLCIHHSSHNDYNTRTNNYNITLVQVMKLGNIIVVKIEQINTAVVHYRITRMFCEHQTLRTLQ